MGLIGTQIGNSDNTTTAQIRAAVLTTTIANGDTTHAPDGNAVFDALALKFDSTSLLRSYLATTVTYNADDTLGDTPLSVTVAAGGIYAIELVIFSASAAKALQLDFGGTATFSNFIGRWTTDYVTFGGVGLSAEVQEGVTSAGDDYSIPADYDGVDSYTVFTGSVEITDAGTFLLRGAQNVSDASNTTILRGSTLTLTKMN